MDSDIAAEALLAREIVGGEGYYTQRLDLQHGETDHWNAYGCSRIYGITGSMQTAAGITCVLLGAILLGTFYFFLRKLSLSRPASITALLVLCALPINGFRNEGRWFLL